MAVQGVIYRLGSVILFLGHLQSGVLLNSHTWQFGAAGATGDAEHVGRVHMATRFDQYAVSQSR
jgi:hypothetical protein